MPLLTQQHRPLQISTPLGEAVLFVTGLHGSEGISRLFRFEVDLIANDTTNIPFEELLGQNVTVSLESSPGTFRYFNGIVSRFLQGDREMPTETEAYIRYRAEVVPSLWLLTKRINSRIFQQLAVPEILTRVLNGVEVKFDLSGKYPARNYCVQYRESDFDFVSRLMEEEGIYYYFRHEGGQHTMMVSDGNAPMLEAEVSYEPAKLARDYERGITRWEKAQEIRIAQCTLRDHCFQLPANPLEASEGSLDSVTAGEVIHNLREIGNEKTEHYEYPAGYGQRFDDVAPGGQLRPQDLKIVFDERQRVARLRMQEEEARGLEIRGAGDRGPFTPGYEFRLSGHFNGNGVYLLTAVEHAAEQAGYRAGQQEAFLYANTFTCIPEALHYRPARSTPKPLIGGVQTATVTGQPGEEIFCDRYGRVKVQFHWDREGKMDAGSSCWVRVAQVWAGNGWGAFFWPRTGHEVVITFEEGDPDRPLIVGSVYNAKNMPWFDLPVNRHLNGFKTASVGGRMNKNFNGLVFNDRPGNEHVSIHSERNLSLNSESDKMIHAGKHKGERVAVANVLSVGKLVPGGGSGGGNFDEGNPLPEPAPYGVLGLNAVVTYGDNMQVACPLNHQLAIGNNVQMCVNPFGLAAGVEGAAVPGLMQFLLGSGMGGNMQFTIGTSAQFTLGQSFEISIGPPKIEIHKGYKAHLAVGIACGVAGAAAVAFAIIYDLMCKSAKDAYDPNASDKDAAKRSEQSGDQNRAAAVLLYQLLMDEILTVILQLESVANLADWLGDDANKGLFASDRSILSTWKAPNVEPDPDVDPNWWNQWGSLAFGATGAVAAIAAEVAALGAET